MTIGLVPPMRLSSWTGSRDRVPRLLKKVLDTLSPSDWIIDRSSHFNVWEESKAVWGVLVSVVEVERGLKVYQAPCEPFKCQGRRGKCPALLDLSRQSSRKGRISTMWRERCDGTHWGDTTAGYCPGGLCLGYPSFRRPSEWLELRTRYFSSRQQIFGRKRKGVSEEKFQHRTETQSSMVQHSVFDIDWVKYT